MNKTELVGLVADKTDLDRKSAAAAVDAVLDGVMGAVQSGDKVSILGFGTFSPSARKAREGRNPRTGLPVHIPASMSVRFVPGSAFKDVLNSKGVAG